MAAATRVPVYDHGTWSATARRQHCLAFSADTSRRDGDQSAFAPRALLPHALVLFYSARSCPVSISRRTATRVQVHWEPLLPSALFLLCALLAGECIQTDGYRSRFVLQVRMRCVLDFFLFETDSESNNLMFWLVRLLSVRVLSATAWCVKLISVWNCCFILSETC